MGAFSNFFDTHPLLSLSKPSLAFLPKPKDFSLCGKSVKTEGREAIPSTSRLEIHRYWFFLSDTGDNTLGNLWQSELDLQTPPPHTLIFVGIYIKIMSRNKLEVQEEINQVLEEIKNLKHRKKSLEQIKTMIENGSKSMVSNKHPQKKLQQIDKKLGERKEELRKLKREYARLQDPKDLLPPM